MNVREAFDRSAQIYDRGRRQLVPCFDDFYSTAIERLPFAADDAVSVLDLGAGTGLLSLLVSLQTPLHTVKPQVHALETQVSSPTQALLQLPQWVASLVRSAQVPLQFVLPVGQTQVELVQIIPPEHTVVQVPQCEPSVLGSTHAPLQVMVPLLQTQVPPVQSSPEVHALPHDPQLS